MLWNLSNTVIFTNVELKLDVVVAEADPQLCASSPEKIAIKYWSQLSLLAKHLIDLQQ